MLMQNIILLFQLHNERSYKQILSGYISVSLAIIKFLYRIEVNLKW